MAKDQEALLKATEAMAKSQSATQAAQSALGQARAQAPPAVQPRLDEAGQQERVFGGRQRQAIGPEVDAVILDALRILAVSPHAHPL